MRIRYTVLMLMALLAAGSRLSAADASSGPLIQFDDQQYNFGKVSAGDPVKHTYFVTNTGTATLVISNVHPSCGCTTAAPWTREIQPGHSGSVPIQFNSSRYSGQVYKSIDVFSNAKNVPHAVLRLTGTIWKPIEINPQVAFINVDSEGTAPATATVHIINQSDGPITISNVHPSSSKLTATLKETKPGKEFELLVSALPPFDVGNTPGTVTMKTSLRSTPNLSVTVLVSRRASVIVSPPQVYLTPSATRWVTNSAFIQNFDFPGFALSDPVCSDPAIKLSLQRLQPQRSMYNLWIASPPGYQPHAGGRLMVTIKTNHPRHPTVQIPLMVLPQQHASWAVHR